MNDEHIRKLAFALKELKELDRLNSYHLAGYESSAIQVPLFMVAGVRDIDARIAFYHDYKGLAFEIRVNFKSIGESNPMIFRHHIFNRDGINDDDILKFSTEVYEVIPKLKLDVDGQLRVPNLIKISISEALHEVFSSIECESVKVPIVDNCPVCLEKTETKTDCKHPICYKCWPKLKACPICRAQLSPCDSDDE